MGIQHICLSDRNGIAKYYFETTKDIFHADIFPVLYDLLNMGRCTVLKNKDISSSLHEVGPIPSFTSPWSSCAMSVLRKVLGNVITKIERTIFQKELDYDKMTQCVYRSGYSFPQRTMVLQLFRVPATVSAFEAFNEAEHMGFDNVDIAYYVGLFQEIGRSPTNVELYDLAQSNSEHSRHWFFRGDLNYASKSLMELVKSTLGNDTNSLVAFSDNSSAIRGNVIQTLTPFCSFTSSPYVLSENTYHFSLTAETHNFPTGVAPFPGAATGVGGRIRDNQALGRGAHVVAGIAGYCVGNLYMRHLGEDDKGYSGIHSAVDTLIGASDGASDYGNKFGEPMILGFTRTFGANIREKRVEWLKPIMFSAGVGQIDERYLYKTPVESDLCVVKVGGPAYRVGIGGGSASSRHAQEKDNDFVDWAAVQRGDPEMGNRLNRFVRSCIESPSNPILSIHDQGAGGTGNVTKELVEPKGADIDVSLIVRGDDSLNCLELWTAEYQEQNEFLARANSLDLVYKIANRENVPITVLGTTNDSGVVRLTDTTNERTTKDIPYPIEMDVKAFLGDIPNKSYKLVGHNTLEYTPLRIDTNIDKLENSIMRVLMHPTVGSKRYLTNKVDRSVTGLIAQQQCVGPFATPLSNYAVTAQSHFDLTGVAVAVGEQPIKGLLNPYAMADMSVGEMLTNIIGVVISDIKDIKLSANWMWPGQSNENKYDLYLACTRLVEVLKNIGIGIDGGKDSLSMSCRSKNETVDCPGSLVLTAYAPVPNIYTKVTPDMKPVESQLLLFDFGKGRMRMGGSVFTQVYEITEKGIAPDFHCEKDFTTVFKKIQEYIREGKILALHDRSDGGLIATVVEMCLSGGSGCELHVRNLDKLYNVLFNEDLGFVVQMKKEDAVLIIDYCKGHKLDDYVSCIGRPTHEQTLTIMDARNVGISVLTLDIPRLRYYWELTSYRIESIQIGKELATAEQKNLMAARATETKIPEGLDMMPLTKRLADPPSVAVLRDEGSNGDREMVSAFYHAGFDVWDVTMGDLAAGDVSLCRFRGIAFVGGFTYADVFGAGAGWAATVKHNARVRKEFETFYERDDIFSLGICNGCQVMSHFDALSSYTVGENDSKRFESRFVTLKILRSNSIFLKGMEGMQLGIWSAHREGKIELADCAATVAVYVDPSGDATTDYPYNPNGSSGGVAGMVSNDGRHMAMMPHPERCFLRWQFPYISDRSAWSTNFSPWFMIFRNAYDWCLET